MTTELTPGNAPSGDQLGPAPERWYCVSSNGAATLCKNYEDAQANVLNWNIAWPSGTPHRASLLVDATEVAQLRHALARSEKLAEDRLQQMNSDHAQALRWRDQLNLAPAARRCADSVIDSGAHQVASEPQSPIAGPRGIDSVQLADSDSARRGLEDMLTAAIGEHGYRLWFADLSVALLVIEAAKRADDRTDWFPRGKWATVQSMQERTEHELQGLFRAA